MKGTVLKHRKPLQTASMLLSPWRYGISVMYASVVASGGRADVLLLLLVEVQIFFDAKE